MKKSIVKKIVTAAILAAIVLSMMLVSACGSKGNTVKVTYDYNYAGAPEAEVAEIVKGDVAEEKTPTRDRYKFDGWFTSADCEEEFDFEVAIEEDVTLYAGWTQTVALVTFDLGEGGEPVESRVDIGGTVAQPVNPTYDGHIFAGWYADEKLTEEFDFTKAVNGDTTVYAKWEEVTGDIVTITYMWNYGGAPNNGVANTAQVISGRKPTYYSATRDGWYLEGWYTDAECKNEFDFDERLNENVTLYARWLEGEKFEAEYVDITGLNGSGYSGGGQLIQKDNYEMNASNGYYLGDLFVPNLTITFNIESDAAVGDAVLVLSLTADYADMTLTDEMFTIKVNGTALSFSDIKLASKPYGSATKQPFVEVTITKDLQLIDGWNKIELIVSNNINPNEGSGTMKATAPYIDYMTIYSSSALSWDPVEENIDKALN